MGAGVESVGGEFGGISTRSWATLGKVILFLCFDLCLLTECFLCADVRWCLPFPCTGLTPCFRRKSSERGEGEPGLLSCLGGQPNKDLGRGSVVGGETDSDEFPLDFDRMVEEDPAESDGFGCVVCVDFDGVGGEH